jgi:hypothetical protein
MVSFFQALRGHLIYADFQQLHTQFECPADDYACLTAMVLEQSKSTQHTLGTEAWGLCS